MKNSQFDLQNFNLSKFEYFTFIRNVPYFIHF